MTPNTVASAAAVAERTSQASISTLGAISATPGTAAAIASRSRCDRPIDVSRISSSCSLVVGAGAHQDVVHAEPLDHRQGLSLGAGSDREHRDHGAHAEHDAEHGERRAHLVRRQVRRARWRARRASSSAAHEGGQRLAQPAALGVAAGLGERHPAAGVETGGDDGEAARERAHLNRRALEVGGRSRDRRRRRPPRRTAPAAAPPARSRPPRPGCWR